MMNEILSDTSNPSLFRTDERMTPRPTIPREYLERRNDDNEDENITKNKSRTRTTPLATKLSYFQHHEETAEEAAAREEKELKEQEEKEFKTIQRNNNSRMKARQNLVSNNHLGSLTARFVRARLLHMKLHILQKLGCFVSAQELESAEEMLFGVEEEASAMGEMVPTDVGAIDDAFQFLVTDLSSRLDEEKHKSGSFASSTWYGALCQQVDDHAKLLVDFRSLQKYSESLEKERDELKQLVERHMLENQNEISYNLSNQQASRTKNELTGPHGGTQKLTLEFFEN